MKRTILILSTLTALSLSGMAQDKALRFTHGLYNGRAWNGWDHSMRVGFVMGYGNHWEATFDAVSTVTQWGDETTMWPSTLTYGEIVKRLDAFFATPENANIDLRSALFVLARKAGGEPEEALRGLIEFERKDASKQSK